MHGDHIPFDKLALIGRELGIPKRFTGWTANGKDAGGALITVFWEIVGGSDEAQRKPVKLHPPLSDTEVLVAVYELRPGLPLPAPTQIKDGEEVREVLHDRRIVTFIEHPVHWAMIESRAELEHYHLAGLFAVDQAIAMQFDLPTHVQKHCKPARRYSEIKTEQASDAVLIINQLNSGRAAPPPQPLKPTAVHANK